MSASVPSWAKMVYASVATAIIFIASTFTWMNGHFSTRLEHEQLKQQVDKIYTEWPGIKTKVAILGEQHESVMRMLEKIEGNTEQLDKRLDRVLSRVSAGGR